MFSKNSFIPPYMKKNLKWYERDGLMTYIDRIGYEWFEEDGDKYLENVNVINFDIIYHQCRGGTLQKDIQNYKTVFKSNLEQMPPADKDPALAACFRSRRKDLNIEKNLRDEYFKTWFNSSSTNSSSNSSSSSNSNEKKEQFSKNREALKRKNQKYFDCW